MSYLFDKGSHNLFQAGLWYGYGDFFMSDSSEEKKKAIEDLQVALKELSIKDALPLREKAMVLTAIEKIEGEQHGAAKS